MCVGDIKVRMKQVLNMAHKTKMNQKQLKRTIKRDKNIEE